MKIYARRTNNSTLLRKYCGTDMWIYAKLGGRLDHCYINIINIDNVSAYVYGIRTSYITLLPKSNQLKEQVSMKLREYIRDIKPLQGASGDLRKCSKDIGRYLLNDIELCPELGIYTTDELFEMCNEVQ